MTLDLAMADCPLCHSAGSVVAERCQLCDAVFGEETGGAVDLPPAAPSAPEPLRFSDVITELQQVGALVSSADGGLELKAACGRLQTLLESLRAQFLTDVVLGHGGLVTSGTQPRSQPKRPVT